VSEKLKMELKKYLFSGQEDMTPYVMVEGSIVLKIKNRRKTPCLNEV